MKFYKLYRDPGKRNKLFAEGIGIQDPPSVRINCPVCGGIWGKTTDPDFRPVIAMMRTNFPDFFSYYIFDLISEKARNTLKNAGITGFTTRRATVLSKAQLDKDILKELMRRGGVNVNKIAEDPPPYYYLEVTGKAKLHAKSEIMVRTCTACGHIHLSTPGCSYVDQDHPKYVDIQTWDGSDFFLAEYFPALVFCSERLVSLVKEAGLTGACFEEVEGI